MKRHQTHLASLASARQSAVSRHMTAFLSHAPLLRKQRAHVVAPLRQSRPYGISPRIFVVARKSLRCSMGEEASSERSYLLGDSESRQASVDLENQTAISVQQNGAPQPQDAPRAPGIIQSTADLDLRVLFAEFLSTFMFIYISTNVTAIDSPSPIAKIYNASIITAVAASFMPVSGAHLNPAVTLALAITNRVTVKRGIAFVFMQLAASALACYLATTVGSVTAFVARAAIVTQGDLIRALFSEIMPMFIIVIIVFQTAVATEQEGGVGNKIAALYIGLTVLACTGTFTQGVFNPAVAFGVSLMAGSFASHWILWVGPCIGACVAALISEHMFLAPASNRRPNSWLAALEKYASGLGTQVKNLGVAGLISYGIMNTLYYSATFTFMMFKIGWSSGAGGIAQAWIVCWTLSQATKPLRLALSVLLAPVINRFMGARRGRGNEENR